MKNRHKCCVGYQYTNCGTLCPVTDHKWGVWSGSANLNAAAATFNRVDVRRPSLALTANSSTVNISELSAFTEKGILEATASVSQTPQRQTHITYASVLGSRSS